MRRMLVAASAVFALLGAASSAVGQNETSKTSAESLATHLSTVCSAANGS